MKRRLFKLILGVLLSIILITAIFIGYVSWKNPTHEDIEVIEIENNQTEKVTLGKEYSALIFNIRSARS